MAAPSVPGMCVLYEHPALHRGLSPRHGYGTFTTQNLNKGTVILVETGLTAASGYGALVRLASHFPKLLVKLAPRRPLEEFADSSDSAFAFLSRCGEVCNANSFVIVTGELEKGPDFAVRQLAVWEAAKTDKEHAEKLRDTAPPPPTVWRFLSYCASIYNGASFEEELNVAYGFVAKSHPTQIFFVTLKDIPAGTELLSYYGPEFTEGGLVPLVLTLRQRVEMTVDVYKAFKVFKISHPNLGAHPNVTRCYEELKAVAECVLPLSTHPTKLYFTLYSWMASVFEPLISCYRTAV